MMTVGDRAAYQRYREARAAAPASHAALYEFLLPMLLFGSMGAITWAIRGTGGWGGIDGTIVPGMTWALLWYYLCRRKGIDARGIALWLGLGIALGGELGYGQYVSWIQGRFQVGDGTIPVAPRVGYMWFVIAGIGWGAPGGIFLGWALHEKTSLNRWLVRIFIPLGVGFLGWLLVRTCPAVFFPNYTLGLYAGELDGHLERTVYTNTQNFVVVAWWVGAMLVAAFQRDRATQVAGALIGGGFGIGFMLGALWCLGYSYAPGYIDWWKMWELNAGFNLGLLYVLVLCWATREVDRSHNAAGVPRVTPSVSGVRRDISLLIATFLLVFVLFFGGTSQMGVLLGLYDAKAVDQYAWPPARIALFAPFVLVILAATGHAAYRIVRRETRSARAFGAPGLPERMADLMMVIGVIGAVTIWPAKIGALYALMLCLALFAFHRLNRRFDDIDTHSGHVR